MSTLGEYLGAGSGTTKLLLNLNGNSTDSSGNSNNGTDTAITYSQANGRFGQGAGFNGSSSKIENSSPSGLPTINGNKTISLWLNIPSLPGVNSYSVFGLFNNTSSPTSSSQITINSSPEGNHISARIWGGGISVNSNFIPTINTWYNIIYTYNGTTHSIYINGKLLNTATTSSQTGNSVFYSLGSYPTNTDQWYNGKLDEIILENVAWTPQQVAKYYANSLGIYATL